MKIKYVYIYYINKKIPIDFFTKIKSAREFK